MRTARWVRRLAFTGAAGFVVAAAMSGGATAAPTADPPNAFSTSAFSRGFEVMANTKPEPFPVSNALDFSVPQAQSDFGAGGQSSADAWLAAPGAVETALPLICVFAQDDSGSSYCNQFPVPGGFPPPYAGRAHASYPTEESAEGAGVLGNKFGGADVGLGLVGARIHAEAHVDGASAVAGATNGTLLKGTPLEVSSGASRTTTSQEVQGSVLVTRAEATVNDISIAGLIKIDSVTTLAEIDNDGVHAPVDKSLVTVKGVTVAGQKATIDDDGIHVAGQGGGGGILGGIGTSASKLLKQAGISITTVGVQKTKIDKHTETVVARGLEISFGRSFKELCAVPQLCQPLPQIPLCDALDGAIPEQIPIGAFLSFCNSPAPSPKDTYLARIAVGASSVTSGASVFTVPPCCSGTTGTSGTTGSTGSGTSGTTGGSTTGTTTGSFTGGSTGFNAGTTSGGFTDGSTGGTNPSPEFPAQAASYGENFGNAAGKLKYLFPIILLVGLGILAGRIDKAPARLPGQPT